MSNQNFTKYFIKTFVIWCQIQDELLLLPMVKGQWSFQVPQEVG